LVASGIDGSTNILVTPLTPSTKIAPRHKRNAQKSKYKNI
jgi:hypothetical protein